MTTVLALRDSTKITVKDTAGQFIDADRDKMIKEAIEEYSRDRPNITDEFLTGDGTAQEFAVPSTWVKGFSVLSELEFPIDEVPINLLTIQDTVIIVQKVAVERIQLISLTLGVGEQARIFFIAPHLQDASTIYVNDEEAVANLASSKIARGLAAFYAESFDPDLADAINYQGKAEIFSALADDLKKMYNDHITQGETDGAVILHSDKDISFLWRRDLLFHPRLLR